MQTIELQRRWDLTAIEVEALRSILGRTFKSRRFKRVRDFRGRTVERAQLTDWRRDDNIVVNTGLNHALASTLDAATQITSWYGALSASNTTPLATHTYAAPGFTEADGDDLDEATRQQWTGGTATGGAIDNSASPIIYTGDQSFTAYGIALVGGGSNPTVFANTAGGGTMYSSVLFGSSHAMDVDVELEIEYELTAADDGV
jgi:hypothetical protein